MNKDNKHSKKRNDMLLFAGIMIIGAALLFVNSASQQPGSIVKVISGHGVYGVYALGTETEIVITEEGRRNVIAISNGSAKMKEANCPGGDCVRQHAADKTGQSVACLPNRILITVEGAADSGIDSVVY